MKRQTIGLLLAVVGWAGLTCTDARAGDDPQYVIETSLGAITVELFATQAPKTVANFVELAQGSKAFTDPASGEQVRRPFYDGLVFHRVIKDFMIQGGCPKGDGTGGPGYRFEDEIDAVGLGLDREPAFDTVQGRPNPMLGIRSQQEFQRQIMMPIFQALGIGSQEQLEARRAEVQQRLADLTVKDVLEQKGYVYLENGSTHRPVRGALAMANAGPGTNGSQFFINLVDTPWLTGRHTVFGRVVAGMDVVDRMGTVAVNAASRPETPVTIVSIRPKSP